MNLGIRDDDFKEEDIVNIKNEFEINENEEINDSGRRIRIYNRKKVEENKEENNEEKRDTH